MAKWSELPSELYPAFAERLTNLIDYLYFRAVCRSWRSATAAPRRNPFFPYIMISCYAFSIAYLEYQQEQEANETDEGCSEEEEDGSYIDDDDDDDKNHMEEGDNDEDVKNDDEDYEDEDMEDVGYCPLMYEFLLPTGYPLGRLKLRMPLVVDHDRWFCFGSSFSWLGYIDKKDQVHLLNPFSGVIVSLPKGRGVIPRSLCLSSPNPNSDTNCIVMVITDFEGCFKKKLAYARPGDDAWTVVLGDGEESSLTFHDIVYHDRNFFAVKSNRAVVMIDFTSNDAPNEVPFLPPVNPIDKNATKYLVSLPTGELLLVVRFAICDEEQVDYETIGFEIYQIRYVFNKSASATLERKKSLGDWTLFLGTGASMALPSSVVSDVCRPNSIYFTDNVSDLFQKDRGSYDIGNYSLDSDCVKRHHLKFSQKYPQPVWIVPQL